MFIRAQELKDLTGTSMDDEALEATPGWRTAIYPGQILLLALVYFLVAKVALLVAIPPGYATAVWPPSGIALAAILTSGARLWPGIWLGAALTNFTIQGAPLLAMSIATGNTLEALVAAALVRKYVSRRGIFQSGEYVMMFFVMSALSGLIAATVGTLSLTLAGALPQHNFSANALTWLQGDVFGMVIVAPLLLAWRWRSISRWSLRKWIEAGVLALSLVSTTVFIFRIGFSGSATLPLTFVALPFIVWTAIRFEQRVVTAAIAMVSAIAVVSTAQGMGPFAARSADLASMLLLGYISTLVITGLILSAVMRQRDLALRAVRQRIDELQERERNLNEFLAMLSHELRNPLAPMFNALAVMRKGPELPTAPLVAIIERQVTHLSHIVNDLLDVSRITRGKVLLQKKIVALNDIATHALEECQPLIAARGHQVNSHLPAELLYVDADPTRMSQVMLNLINNAAKYTPEGGDITISLRRENDLAVLSVRDSGIGIPAMVLPRVFDLFVQGDRGLDRSEGGLGIGLTIARRLVELHGGTIAVASAGQNAGSEFVVRLPIVPAPPALAAESSQAQSSASVPRRLLVCDDHRENADTLSVLLRLGGHEVKTVYDGRAAIELASRFRPDAVLLDIGLPGMNGYAVARELRKAPQGAQMLLIAVSGYGQDEDRRRSREAGFDHHLVKPVDPAQLTQIIDNLATLT